MISARDFWGQGGGFGFQKQFSLRQKRLGFSYAMFVPGLSSLSLSSTSLSLRILAVEFLGRQISTQELLDRLERHELCCGSHKIAIWKYPPPSTPCCTLSHRVTSHVHASLSRQVPVYALSSSSISSFVLRSLFSLEQSAPFAAYTSNKKDTPHRFDLAQCQTSECDAIDTDDQVTVRGEVARLTRLYDKAVKTNTLNDPDMYATGGPGDLHSSALRDRTAQAGPATIAPPVPVAAPAPETTEPTPAAVAPEDLDAAPATKSPEPEPSQPKDSDPPAEGKPPTTTEEPSSPAAAPTDSPPFGSSNDQTAAIDDTATSATGTATAASSSTTTTSAPAATAASDPDESPATAAHLQKHSQDTTDVEEKK